MHFQVSGLPVFSQRSNCELRQGRFLAAVEPEQNLAVRAFEQPRLDKDICLGASHFDRPGQFQPVKKAGEELAVVAVLKMVVCRPDEGTNDHGLSFAVGSINDRRRAILEFSQDLCLDAKELKPFLKEKRVQLVSVLELRKRFIGALDHDRSGFLKGHEIGFPTAQHVVESPSGNDVGGKTPLVDPAATSLGDQNTACLDISDELLDIGLGHHHRIRDDEQLVLAQLFRIQVHDMEKIHGHISFKKGSMDSLQRFAESVGPDGLPFSGVCLLAANHMGKGIIENRHLGPGRAAVEKKVHVVRDNPGDFPSFNSALCDLSVKLYEPVSSGFITGVHRVVSVDIDRPGPARHRRPHPVAEILAHDRNA